MEFNKLVFAGLSVGCLAAAAGGSYLAVRQNQAAIAAPVSFEAPLAPAAPGAPVAPGAPAGAVTESEGVIAPETVKPAAPVAPARRAPASISSAPSRSSRVEARPAPRAPVVERRSEPVETPVASSAPAPR